MLDFDELETSIDEMIKELQTANSTIDSYETIIADDSETIYEQRKELAAQRRTIATLRARLAYKSQGYQEDVCFLGDRFNQYRRVGNEFRRHDLHGLHEVRIAAIRNFGALP